MQIKAGIVPQSDAICNHLIASRRTGDNLLSSLKIRSNSGGMATRWAVEFRMFDTAKLGSGISLSLRVYYEDTDAAGIVYYANYFRFIERGRTELLRTLGHDQNALMKEGIAFAVRSTSAEFLKPARLDDLLTVETTVTSLGRAQVTFAQRILRDHELLLDAKIRVACIDPARGKPVPMPRPIHDQLAALTKAVQ